MNLKKFGKVFTSKFVGTGTSSYEKRLYRAAVSQRLRNTGLYNHADRVYLLTYRVTAIVRTVPVKQLQSRKT